MNSSATAVLPAHLACWSPHRLCRRTQHLEISSLTGTNGGAGFLLVYLLATLLVGLPVMIVETMLGRHGTPTRSPDI